MAILLSLHRIAFAATIGAMDKPARPSKITIPQHAHPLARLAFTLMRDQGITYMESEFRSGVLISTLKSWRCHATPSLTSIEAVLGALGGWRLVPCPPLSALTDAQRERLEELGLDFLSDDEALAVAIACATSDPAPRYTADTPAPLIDYPKASPKALAKRWRFESKKAAAQ